MESSAQAVQMDGSPEDEGTLSASATLAREAAKLFQSEQYQDCIDILNQLLQKKENDLKVQHNIAVAECNRDGCTDPQKLLGVLDMVKNRSEELVRAAGDQLECTNSPSNNSSTVISKLTCVTGAQQTSGSSNTDGITYMDEYDTSIATLNTAVILYNLQHHENAMSILEPLYQNIEPIDETTALRICLLMLDIALASHEAAKAADVLQYMEKAFDVSPQSESGGSLQNLSTNQSLKVPLSTSANIATAEGATGATATNVTVAPAATSTTENSLTRTLSDETCDYEALLSTFDNDSQNLGRSFASLAISSETRPSIERPAPASDLKLLLHLYKVRLFLLTRNLKATKREVKLAMNIARGRDPSTAYLKAQLEYSRGNHRKAIKLLTTCRTEQGMSCMLFNNLGCIHYKLRKYHLASVYFRKAYQSSATLGPEKPFKLAKLSQDKSQSIMYNCGMLQLTCGNPNLAAYGFQWACCLYYNQPLLWLRLAECCISAQEKGLLKTPKSDSVVKEDRFNVHVIGDGRWRHIMLPDRISIPVVEDIKSEFDEGFDNLKNSSSPGEESFFELGQPVKVSLSFARQCLHMSLWLLKRNDNRGSTLVGSGVSVGKKEDDDSNQAAPLNNTGQSSTSIGDSKGLSNTTVGITKEVNANGDPKDCKGNTGSSNPIFASVETYEEMQRKDNMLARQAALADLAYVELCLENPLKALTAAQLLLQQPECSKAYVYLARIYAAESLCRLNQPQEAVEYLSVCVEEGNTIDLALNANDEGQKCRSADNSEASGDGEDTGSSMVYNSSTTGRFADHDSISHMSGDQSTVYVNLASVFAMQGDLQQAHQYATQAVSLSPTIPSAVLSLVYVELLQGKTQEAISKLKQCRQLYVASSTLISCSSS